MPVKRSSDSYIGEKYNKLTIIKLIDDSREYKKVLCKCECGKKKIIKYYPIVYGNIKSCGCIKKRPITHGLRYHSLYNMYQNMLGRCRGNSEVSRRRYKDRGIKVCKDWLGENGLINFINWAESLPENKRWKKGRSIDRRNNDKGYYPANCRFVTQKIQTNNKEVCIKVKYKNKIWTTLQLSKISDIPQSIIQIRLGKGWNVKDAITTPVKKVKDKNKFEYKNKMYTIKELAKLGEKSEKLIARRLRKKWSVKDAVEIDVRRWNNNE